MSVRRVRSVVIDGCAFFLAMDGAGNIKQFKTDLAVLKWIKAEDAKTVKREHASVITTIEWRHCEDLETSA
jgi:hypothetical protein